MREEEYRLQFFKDNGFKRFGCGHCGRHYWTLGDVTDNCGEPPCSEYTFIGNSPAKKPLSIHDMRELYLSYFEKKGHTRVNRYPIVARWRDDVFFTQASIYDFQPWVINGVVEPPANPLVISQPCVRFNDIDNVGKTGRHTTMFEMLAHHAFNKKDNFIYFKDKTVELCHSFLTEAMGIEPEKMNYVEEVWGGGGNSGPCLEVIICGAEVATLVFIMYRDEGENKIPLDMQVVDPGYGLERLTWLSQGSPSAYEAVFGPVLQDLKNETKVEVDDRILCEYSRVAGMVNVETEVDMRDIGRKVADRLGITVEELICQTRPLQDLYVICDHAKALMFLLADGIVPSNVKEGYFARLLVRRAMRSLSSMKLSLPLTEIVEKHMKYFRNDFPEVIALKDDIFRLLEIEEEKYRETLKKGKETVQKLERRLKTEGKQWSNEELIHLYDSHGLTPDLVQQFSTFKIDMPDDFYIQVSKRHERREEERVKEVSLPRQMDVTRLGYYDDPGKSEFKARILDHFDDFIVLDRTYFYPEGGGQESDRGTIGDMEVLNVQRVGNVILHKVKRISHGIEKGKEIDCRVDMKRRRHLTVHHTATHVLNGAARKILGNHVWQTGAHKGEDVARLDITHYASLTPEEIEKIEVLANEVVLMNLPVHTSFMERNKAETKYGFRLYQGGAVPGKEIRVVNISEWDVEACGGTQVQSTGEVGLIKLLGSKRIQDGVVRLEFVAGRKALEHFQRHDKTIQALSEIFDTSPERLLDTLTGFRDELKGLRNRLETRKEKELQDLAKNLINSAEKVGGLKVATFVDEQGETDILNLAKLLRLEKGTLFLLASLKKESVDVALSHYGDIEVDCGALMQKISKEVEGSGGGKKDFAQGRGKKKNKIREAFDNLKKELACT